MKRKYGIILSIFLVSLAICTYVSFQVYNANLPTVKTEAAVSTVLRYNWPLTGSVHHKDAEPFSLPVPVQVVQRSVEPGQWVKEGSRLLQLDSARLHLQWLQCKDAEEMLLQKIDRSTSYQKEILELQMAQLQETIELLEQLRSDEGWVKASAEGLVLYIGASKAAANEPLAVIAPVDGVKQLVFPLTKEQLAYCPTGTRLKAEVVIGEEKTTLDIYAERSYYDAARQGYCCVVTTDAAINMMEGESVTAWLSAVSGLYETVIPTAAIVECQNGNASFYVLRQQKTALGTQYYTMLMSACVLEQNEIFTALSAPITEQVISAWSEPLTNNVAVRVIS